MICQMMEKLEKLWSWLCERWSVLRGLTLKQALNSILPVILLELLINIVPLVLIFMIF